MQWLAALTPCLPQEVKASQGGSSELVSSRHGHVRSHQHLRGGAPPVTSRCCDCLPYTRFIRYMLPGSDSPAIMCKRT